MKCVELGTTCGDREMVKDTNRTEKHYLGLNGVPQSLISKGSKKWTPGWGSPAPREDWLTELDRELSKQCGCLQSSEMFPLPTPASFLMSANSFQLLILGSQKSFNIQANLWASQWATEVGQEGATGPQREKKPLRRTQANAFEDLDEVVRVFSKLYDQNYLK